MARNPFGGSSSSDDGGIYLGKVTKVAGATAYVEVPRLSTGYEFPARFSDTLLPKAAETTGAAGSHGHGASSSSSTSVDNAGGHDHGAGSLKAGPDDLDVHGSTDTAGGHGHSATTTTSTSVDSAGNHTHTLPDPAPPLAPGDEVAVAFLDGDAELVILLRLA